jgi:hypothetical protein
MLSQLRNPCPPTFRGADLEKSMMKSQCLAAMVGALLLPATLMAAPGAQIAESTIEGIFDVVDGARLPANKIVNGILEYGRPSVGMVRDQQGVLCSGTLVGCRHVMTAANCFCTDPDSGIVVNGNECANRGDLLDANKFKVFLPHAGTFDVAKISVNPSFLFTEEQEKSDVALIELKTPVTGIKPTPLNRGARPAQGTLGTIVGYGRTAGAGDDFLGLKRSGQVQIANCTEAPAASNICWNFNDPIGPQGTDSNSCDGDAGGPVLVDNGSTTVAAGVMASGTNPDCEADDQAWNTDVSVERAWLDSVGGSDLNRTTCGNLPQAGSSGATILGTSNELITANELTATFNMPQDTGLFRLSLNAQEFNGTNADFDIYARAGAPPTTTAYDCASFNTGVIESCEVQSPDAGTWHVLVTRRSGSGRFQVTATIFAKAATTCTPGTNVLCLDDQNGDRRFKVTLDYASPSRGISGQGKAIGLNTLGVRRGGLFWFFTADNPEVLVKVLNGCTTNNRFWVFLTAGTDVGYTVTVTDTTTGVEKVYTNRDLQAAQPAQDTQAFSCASN